MALTVFTDLPEGLPDAEKASLPDLISDYPPFYTENALRNVFKLRLIALMQDRYPGETVTWVDADMLVFDDLGEHLVEGQVNAVSHGRRDGQQVNCGDGLTVPGDRYAISGLFSIPPGSALDFLEEVVRQRPDWRDTGVPNHKIGDQLILNHLVARWSGGPVNWVSDDRRFIYNLEIGSGLHPVVGDPRLREITWRSGRPFLDGRRIVLFYWIKNKLDLHLDDNFESFAPKVARRLRRLYED